MINKYLNNLISGPSEPALPPDFGRLVNPIPTRGQIMPTNSVIDPRILRPSGGSGYDGVTYKDGFTKIPARLKPTC